MGLDAGSITLTGPAGLAITLAPQLGLKGVWRDSSGRRDSVAGGTFTFTGSGGADVGPFTSTRDRSRIPISTGPIQARPPQ